MKARLTLVGAFALSTGRRAVTDAVSVAAPSRGKAVANVVPCEAGRIERRTCCMFGTGSVALRAIRGN